MTNPLSRLWRHPRRLGFILFNLILIGLIFIWGAVTSKPPEGGLVNLPAQLIGPAGTILLLGLLAGVWIAWALFVLFRHRPR